MNWRHGTTRSVLLIGRYAIKFPTTVSWRNFLQGILCNGSEHTFSKMNCEFLAPVVWRSWLDLVIVMPRADVKSYEEDDEIRFEYLEDFWQRVDASEQVVKDMIYGIVENKICSVGKINGVTVAVDYGSI